MSVRAKFYVSSIVQSASHPSAGSPSPPVATITLVPIYGPGNEAWSKATPCGEIKLTVTNPAAAEQFSPGQGFFVDFTPAE